MRIELKVVTLDCPETGKDIEVRLVDVMGNPVAVTWRRDDPLFIRTWKDRAQALDWLGIKDGDRVVLLTGDDAS